MKIPKYSKEISSMDALTKLDEDTLSRALDNFTRASKSDEWRDYVYVNIIQSDVLNLDKEQIGVLYDFYWHNSLSYGIPVGSIKMLLLTR